ncbi:putative protein [BD1-7 clade bacterium]|uniref:Uncharacterized protein n=1 Tax=BD1-7 clade bacterium TaxID=2029982 RepID=A0A5S9QKH4_9GAMM|nr:putative protein [BD1-7 clade bacterium]
MDTHDIECLLDAKCYPHPVSDFKLRETHISWVILTGDFAYKIKKPVDYGFVDFSRLSDRHFFCKREVELNRQFTKDIYLDVVGVIQTADGFQIANLSIDGELQDTEGKLIDYAIRMTQFDDNQQLDHLASRGELTTNMCIQTARMLAGIHQSLSPLYPKPGELGSPERLKDAVAEDFDLIFRSPHTPEHAEQLKQLEKYWNAFFQNHLQAFNARIKEGFVHDGHGDTHLGNIVLIDNDPVLFDCIEFNDNFRVMDCMGEIGFLTMDVESKGLMKQSNALLNEYLEQTGDYGGLYVLNLFRIHYALVRAKINLVKCDPKAPDYTNQPDFLTYQSYFALADSYCQERRHQEPALLIMHGLSGSGKSTVAGAIASTMGGIRIRSDVERKRLFGLGCNDPSDKKIYTSQASDMTFSRLTTLAELVLEQGFTCIVDATFLHKARRKPLQKLAQRLNVPCVIVSCELKTETMTQRLIEREKRGDDVSEATVEIMQQQALHQEPLTPAEKANTIVVSTDNGIPENLQQLISAKIDNSGD